MERMRGINIGGWLSQIDAIQEKDPDKFPGIDKHMETFITGSDFANVKSWGFDHARIPVDSYLFFTEDENPIENRILCNEFGVYTPVELQAQLRWYDDLLSVLKEMGIGFSYWNYKNLDFGIISTGEKLHENLPQYNNSQRINYPVLDVIRKY